MSNSLFSFQFPGLILSLIGRAMFIVTIRDRTEGDLSPPDRTFKDDARDDADDETVFDVMII